MKRAVFSLCYWLGVTRFASWWNRKRVTILCYHGVTERPTRRPDDPFGLHVRLGRFLAQLEHLQQWYRVISLREYLDAREEGVPLPDYSVVLTFDDGYRNFLTVAWPRLRECAMPATMFLITDRMPAADGVARDRAWTPADDETCLSWDEVEMLERSPAVDFGSHTCSHAKLTTLSAEQVQHELRSSHDAVLSRLKGCEGLPLAYPYGDTSEAIVEQARSVGYRCGLTTEEGANDAEMDRFALRRVLIGDNDATPAFAARVSGLTRWLKMLWTQRPPVVPLQVPGSRPAPVEQDITP